MTSFASQQDISESGFHALIVAAGKGHRAGGSVPKQLRLLAGEAVLSRTVSKFARHPGLKRLILVVSRETDHDSRQLLAHLPYVEFVPGGDTRQASVRAGLEALSQENEDDVVLIHDAARPFASPDLISTVARAALKNGAAIPTLPVIDTLKSVSSTRKIVKTIDRSTLQRAQTPQAFRLGLILKAHRDGIDSPDASDDATLLERSGQDVLCIDGEAGNIKLTTHSDFKEAERRLAPYRETRAGIGYDVHRFTPQSSLNQSVWLFGVEITHSRSLQGHSDADVGLHAITDALLGAIAAGDIGQHFPPGDPQWRGASSDIFLAHARDLVLKQGGRILHIDATAICEKPKLTPHRDQLRSRVAEILEMDLSRISIKATTTEKLGFTGREEGIACQAIATIDLPAEPCK